MIIQDHWRYDPNTGEPIIQHHRPPRIRASIRGTKNEPFILDDVQITTPGIVVRSGDNKQARLYPWHTIEYVDFDVEGTKYLLDDWLPE